jgi:molybdopterin molybdotransferase
MISVEEALGRILAAFGPLPSEQVALSEALGRVLAEPVISRRMQPPADVSAMDGYAARAADVGTAPVTLRLVGESAAGGSYDQTLGEGETARIFTGAPVPDGADCIIIQEVTDANGEAITVKEAGQLGRHIRKAGLDFKEGDLGLPAGRRMSARDMGVAAAMNNPWLTVRRRPRVAILATGDEVVMPGDPIGPNQIVSSNSLALAGVVEACGGDPVMLGIAPDDADGLEVMTDAARGHDLLLTSGGVSVGDHDLVRKVLDKQGLDLDFWRVAIRPGKPLMFGMLESTPVLGLPGNPVSALVCALVFMRPAMAVMLGADVEEADRGYGQRARLAHALPANNMRQDYMRAQLTTDGDGVLVANTFDAQDSSMLSLLAASDCLLIRPPKAPEAAAGDMVDIMLFPTGL